MVVPVLGFDKTSDVRANCAKLFNSGRGGEKALNLTMDTTFHVSSETKTVYSKFTFKSPVTGEDFFLCNV